MADFIFKISPNIILGPYTLTRLGQVAAEWGSNFMLIADPLLKEFGLPEKAITSLEEKNLSVFTYDDIPATPTTETLENALSLARGAHIHGVIALGGINTTSLGRAVAALYTEKSSTVYEFLAGTQVTGVPLPFIAIPTTFRDPFMFMDQTPVIDARNRQVRLIKIHPASSKAVIIDPNTYMHMSPHTAMSILFHGLSLAIEGYISTKSNFFSETILTKAIELLLLTLDPDQSKLVGTPAEILTAQGGFMASIGVGVSSPGLITAVALACNARNKISMALVSSVLLPYMLEDAMRAKVDKIANIAKMLGIPDSGLAASDMAQAAVEDIRRRLALSGLPTRLKDLGLSIDHLASIVEDAIALDIMNYIPRAMSTDDLFDLIKQAY
ncbi:iron-containing alcohol dehydrogenase [Brucepastera parasyntrophica]|uniref:iron-containing alcohol dehydrogenase n=1 Tax=Brucepastera parasyntrophica TaxID=2880008 RepID=UPI00210C79EA|nr:iron-containing alcohol dehydrogenase [Brucepastera parasyntrophica]ULQ58979.1 iron-containing alcohol dehydrogenase [Brucepastera parasyntrophica]